MSINKQEYAWIYNFQQCNFYFENGLVPIVVGKGNEGEVYLKFKRDNEYERVFGLWCSR